MGKYSHLEGQKERILKELRDYEHFETMKGAIAFLGDLYHRKCISLPTYISRYSSPHVKEAKTKQHINIKLKCPNCRKRVIEYFKQYAANTK